jgi:predicted nucleotidyltransferase
VKEIVMLDLDTMDLRALAEALEDHSDYTTWWLDPETGQVEAWSVDEEWSDTPDQDHPAERGWRRVDPASSNAPYQDMSDFAHAVPDPQAARPLQRAIAGRGAFRRFKDELWELGELRNSWLAFHDARRVRRTLTWLVDEELVSETAAQHYADAHPLPAQPELSGPFDAEALATAVTQDLRDFYGESLLRVLLYGSWARGDAAQDSDVDLLAVLAEDPDPIAERVRIADLVWQQSLRAGRVVSVAVVSRADFERPRTPFLTRVVVEAREVA